MDGEIADLAAGKADRDALAALAGTVDGRRYEFLRIGSRPGDAPARFTLAASSAALGGPEAMLPMLPPATLGFGDAGYVARLAGSGIVAMRQSFAIEPGRVYRLRMVVQRRTDSSDPTNDTVRLGIAWLDQAGNLLPPNDSTTVIADIATLRVSSARREYVVTVAHSAGAAVDVVAPARTREARAYVQCFGLDAVTDIEVLGAADVSDAYLLDPVSTDAIGRIATLRARISTRVSRHSRPPHRPRTA